MLMLAAMAMAFLGAEWQPNSGSVLPAETVQPAAERRATQQATQQATQTARDIPFTVIHTDPVVEYAILLPPRFDALKPVPVLLTLPPGKGDKTSVQAALNAYWQTDAQERGWVVISPVLPDATAWEALTPTLIQILDHIAASMRPEGNLFHLAGVSAGGVAAFDLAIAHPGRFASLTVLPGAPKDAATLARLDRLRTVPVTMFVGGDDTAFWLAQSREAHRRLKDLGFASVLHELAGQGHRVSVDKAALFDALDQSRPNARAAQLATAASKLAIATALDDFHDAASKADEIRYFAHFAKEGVFLGTDGSERWTVAQFRAYAAPYFQKGTGWTYAAVARNIEVAGDAAWFDETLTNAKYGLCRGTGVLVRRDGRWLIAQYNLSKPVPNALMQTLVDLEKTPPDAGKP